MTMSFEPATNAAGGDWLASALRDGTSDQVSRVIPSGFEAYAAIRHPAWRCECTHENLPALRSGHGRGQPIRWAEVGESNLPVVYGFALHSNGLLAQTRQTQYRRMEDGRWVMDELLAADLVPVLQCGDAWMVGPAEGSLEPELARILKRVLRGATSGSDACWFGIWEGFGYLSEAQRRAPSIATRDRTWHLFRAPLDCLDCSFANGFAHQPANLVWPEDRSWCLATEIDSEATYIGGSKELLTAVLEERALETEPVHLEDRLASLRDILKPVVDKPVGASLPPGFESREYSDWLPGFDSRWTKLKSALMGMLWLLRSRRKIEDGIFRADGVGCRKIGMIGGKGAKRVLRRRRQ